MEALTLFEKINPHLLYCQHLPLTAYPAGHSFGKRTCKWFEIEYFSEGQGGTMIRNGKTLPVCRGDIHFRTPGTEVEGFTPYGCYLVCFDLVYDPAKEHLYRDNKFLFAEKNQSFPVSEGLSVLFPSALPVNRPNEFEALFRQIFYEYLRYGTQSAEAGFLLKATLMQILKQLRLETRNGSVPKSQSRSYRNNAEKVERVRNWIDTHIDRKFSLEELAREAQLSPNFLCRIFKSFTGKTLTQYISQVKITYAKQLLIRTEQSVKAIAVECGFLNESYFFILFKRSEGISPLEFRARNRQYESAVRTLNP